MCANKMDRNVVVVNMFARPGSRLVGKAHEICDDKEISR